MSTTPNEEDRKLPATWEEYQRARREAALIAFAEGARWIEPSVNPRAPSTVAAATDYVRRRYPITKRVPRVGKVKGFYARVETNNGTFENITGIRFYLDRDCTQRHTPHWHDAESVAAMADLLANPFEEVTE